MQEVRHLHIQKQRLVGILDIEGVETSVLRNHGHIRLVVKIFDSGFHADDILSPVSLSRNQVRRPQIHIAHCGREKYVDGLVISDLKPVRRYHPVEHQLACQTVVEVAVLVLLRIDILLQGQSVRMSAVRFFGYGGDRIRNMHGGTVVPAVLKFLCVRRTHDAQ